MFAFLFTKRLLAGVGSIIGDEITLSPIQHIRPFMAGTDGNMSTGPQWHMDQAVTLEEADEADEEEDADAENLNMMTMMSLFLRL